MISLLIASLLQIAHAHAKITIPADAPEACKKFIEETLPKHWTGGFIQVPQNWNRQISNENPAINVFYYYDETRNLETSIPILFLRGGPFGHAQPNVQALDQQMQKYDSNKKHTLVIIDQRGTGCSFPLIRKPLPQSETELSRIDLDIVRMYSSDDIVNDAEQIRRSIFKTKKWKIFGQSFGGTIVHRYIYNYPEALISAHSHAPSVHHSWTEFARLRLLAQQKVLNKFLEHYAPHSSVQINLMQKAIDILHSEAGKEICLPEKGLAPRVCGKPLMDAVLADIGQGPSQIAASGQYDNWDKISKKLLLVIDGNLDAFKIEAEKAMDSFFRNDRSLIAFVSWSQEMPMHADLDKNCTNTYDLLRSKGVDPDSFGLDECRIILNAIPPSVKRKLANEFKPGSHLLSQNQVIKKLRRCDIKIPYYVYTGQLDFFGQTESIQDLIQASDVVQHHEFANSGHSGWAFEPLVWANLMLD